MSAHNKDLYWAIKAMAKELSFADFGCAIAGPVSHLCRSGFRQKWGSGRKRWHLSFVACVFFGGVPAELTDTERLGDRYEEKDNL